MAEARSVETLGQMAVAALAALPQRRPGADLLYCPASLAGRPVAWDRPVRTHVPAYPELVYVQEAGLTMVTPTGPVHVRPGQLLVIPPGVEHGEVWEGAYDAVFLPIYTSNARFFRCTSHPPRVTSMYLLGRTDLAYVTGSLLQELTDRDTGFEDSVYGLLLHLHSILRRRLARGSFLDASFSGAPGIADAHSWLVIQATLEYLSAHFREPVDAADVARHLKYSLAHLNRLALRFLGKSVSKCLRDLRMTHARDLLRNSDLSVAEIADRVGYSDASNFRRAFKQAVGVGLKEYRTGRDAPIGEWDTASDMMRR